MMRGHAAFQGALFGKSVSTQEPEPDKIPYDPEIYKKWWRVE